MTTGALEEERPTLFLRKATGLVRGWSVRDSMIYATLSTNVITLGMVEWAYQSTFPKGSLLSSILISGVWVSFLVIAYAGLVVTIPRVETFGPNNIGELADLLHAKLRGA